MRSNWWLKAGLRTILFFVPLIVVYALLFIYLPNRQMDDGDLYSSAVIESKLKETSIVLSDLKSYDPESNTAISELPVLRSRLDETRRALTTIANQADQETSETHRTVSKIASKITLIEKQYDDQYTKYRKVLEYDPGEDLVALADSSNNDTELAQRLQTTSDAIMTLTSADDTSPVVNSGQNTEVSSLNSSVLSTSNCYGKLARELSKSSSLNKKSALANCGEKLAKLKYDIFRHELLSTSLTNQISEVQLSINEALSTLQASFKDRGT